MREVLGIVRCGSAPLAWLAQLTVLALLLIVPVLARSAAIATVATLAAAIPGTLILSVAGGSNDEAAVRPLLGGLLVIAWVVGLAYAVARHAATVRRVSERMGRSRASLTVTYPERMPRRRDPRDLSNAAQEYLLALRVTAGPATGRG